MRQNQESLVLKLKAHTKCPAIGAATGIMKMGVIGSASTTGLQNFTIDPANPNGVLITPGGANNIGDVYLASQAMASGAWSVKVGFSANQCFETGRGNGPAGTWYVSLCPVTTPFTGRIDLDSRKFEISEEAPAWGGSLLYPNPYTIPAANTVYRSDCYWGILVRWFNYGRGSTGGDIYGSLNNFTVKAVRQA